MSYVYTAVLSLVAGAVADHFFYAKALAWVKVKLNLKS
jgi:hypothetical protein